MMYYCIKNVFKQYILILPIFLLHFSNRPGGIPAKNAKGENVLLFLGIIDILQSFRLKKKLEHAWKSVLHDGVILFIIFLLFI